MAKQVRRRVVLRLAPSKEGERIEELEPGAPFLLLDDTLGWAWGYAGKDRRVGYVESGAIAA
jgi:hypothetical protein